MRRASFFLFVLTCSFAIPARAQDQQDQSLADAARAARKAKADRDKSATPATHVFNEENMPSSGAGKADLAQLSNSDATTADRLAAGRRAIAHAEETLDALAPLDRATLAQLALQGQNSDFPGRQAWEQKLFAAKEYYVSHGRDLFRQTKELMDNAEALSANGKLPRTDPRITDMTHKALQLMQDANRTDADFQAILLEGQDLAKRGAAH